MGWANIVDFVQSSLERMGSLAGIPAARCVRMGEPSPLLELSTPRHYHSFYVDNYDGFTVVASTDLGLYEGKPSDAQLQLREVFQTWNIGRDEKKAVEGTLSWTSLGGGTTGTGRSGRKLEEVSTSGPGTLPTPAEDAMPENFRPGTAIPGGQADACSSVLQTNGLCF